MRVVNGSVGTMGPMPLDVGPAGINRSVRANGLPRWGSSIPNRGPADYSGTTAPRHQEPPFTEDQGLNKKIALW